jgi:hypothetical protein
VALGLHAGLATADAGERLPLKNFDRVRLVRLWTEGDYSMFVRYLATLEDGARALASLGGPPNRVLVLDFVGPFSAGLGLRPPSGDSTWHHWGRTLDETHSLAPERLFGDVQVVMDPKLPIETWTADGLRTIYARYLGDYFELARETAHWRIYVPVGSQPEAVSQSVDDESDT